MADQVIGSATWIMAAQWAKELAEEKINDLLFKEASERQAKRLALREFYTARFTEVFMKLFGVEVVIHPDEIQIVGFGNKDCALFEKDDYTFRLTPASGGAIDLLNPGQIFVDFLLTIGKETQEFYEYDPEIYGDHIWIKDTVSSATQVGYALDELEAEYETIAAAIQAAKDRVAIAMAETKPILDYPERNTMNFLRETAESIELGEKLSDEQQLIVYFTKLVLHVFDLDIPF